jgi:hypothetical protein
MMGMNEMLLFFVIVNDKVMRRIIVDFIRQMVRDGEILEGVEIFDTSVLMKPRTQEIISNRRSWVLTSHQ